MWIDARFFGLASVSISTSGGRRTVEGERRQILLAARLRAGPPAVQPAGDHEVEHEEQLALELPDNPLTQPAKADNAAALDGEQIGLDGANDEWAAKRYALDREPA